jgi:hypothetical protein
MRKHLFYTFLAVFIGTALVTLAGVAGVISIDPGILQALVGVLLLEVAFAIIALFKKTDFAETPMTPQDAELAALRDQVVALSAENEALKSRLGEHRALEDRVWFAINHASIMSFEDICGILGLQKEDHPARDAVSKILGRWLQEGRIRSSTPNPSYFQVTKEAK